MRIALIFLKFPTPGRVKTRLAADLGEEGAAEAYRRMVARVFEQCRRAGPDAIAVCFDPPNRLAEITQWLSPHLAGFPGEVLWIMQSPGDLGSRLENGCNEVFRKFPRAKVAVLGTDCIQLDSEIFEEAWSHTRGENEVAYGPTGDGGYYLVAMSRPHPELFREIPWSCEETLSASLSAAENAGLSTHLLPERTDIDTIEEWRQFEPELADRPCVFFDRDGVVNASPGPGYVLAREDFHLNEGIAEALKVVCDKGYLAIIITSQKGVGKGLMSQSELNRIHRSLQRDLQSAGVSFDGIYAYTGTPDCIHRPKPDPEMILSAGADFFVDLSRSWMVGDADRDIEMGIQAKLKGTIRVLGTKKVGVKSTHDIQSVSELTELLKKIL